MDTITSGRVLHIVLCFGTNPPMLLHITLAPREITAGDTLKLFIEI